MTGFKQRTTNSQFLALFVPLLVGGGAERVMVNLANMLAERGLQVDLVVANAHHPEAVLQHQISPHVRVIDLKASGVLRALPRLVKYLRQNRPFALLSTLNHANIIAIIAKHLAFTNTRVIIRLSTTLSLNLDLATRHIDKHLDKLARLFFPWADGIIAVSEGVAQDLTRAAHISRHRIQVIHNPLPLPEIETRSQGLLTHPWFKTGEPPVIMAVGRLSAEKDFPTLIHAFAQVRQLYPSRLLILGEGPERPALEALIADSELTADVSLPGFAENPYPYMRHAAVMVLSSLFEGFPNVLLEAMACGCPVVSTDCPSGPAEILIDERYGRLVPVRNPQALAQAILATLQNPPDPAVLQERVQAFAPDIILERYLAVLRGD